MENADKDYTFHYNEVVPSSAVDHLATSFFEFSITGESKSPIPHEVFPDGCVSLLYRRNELLELTLLLIKGLSLESFHTDVFPGDILWGVRLSPAACAAVLRREPNSLTSQPLLDQTTLPHLTANLLEKFDKCEDFPQAISIFETVLIGLRIGKEDINKKVSEAVKLIERSSGEMKIAELANAVNLRFATMR